MKGLHKRLGRQVVKYRRHFTKYLYERDTIFATLWVFVFIVGLGLIPLNFTVLNQVKLALKDFDLTDVTYAKLDKAKNTSIDKNIVIINVGHLDREGIALLIEKTASMQPRVMGLDALFYEAGEPATDSILNETLRRHQNLVAGMKLVPSDKGDTVHTTGDYFKTPAHFGHVTFFGEENTTLRYFDPFETDYAGKMYPFFATALVQQYDSLAYQRLLKKNHDKVQINYERRLQNYQVIQPEDLFEDKVEDSAIRGKIALLGYINANPDDIEDKKFTPMNDKIAGKAIPDMNGIVVHANIISMALDNEYIKKLPSWVNWLVAVLICWLHMSFFVRYYLENHIWFHLVAKIAQLLSAFFFSFIGIFLFDNFGIKLDMKYSLICIVLAVDVIYFYEAFAVWAHKKFKYHTVFHQKHH